MDEHHVELYGFSTSPFVLKVGAFLEYKQIPFDWTPVNPLFRSRQMSEFEGQEKVPVLKIDDEWRGDSTPIGIWLEEVFPDRPILGETEADREEILEIDQWVTDQLLNGRFRETLEWESTWDSIRNGWKLADILHDSTPLPYPVRRAWPFIIRYVGPVPYHGNHMDRSEPLPEMRDRQRRELLQHLGDGPFLGGRDQVSLADLSAYTTIVTPHLMGMHGELHLLDDPDVVAWCHRVQEHLPDNPLVVPDHLLERELP
jgi:glutathione S-transferase